MNLSREARIVAGLTILTVPTIMYGGVTLLGVLTNGIAGIGPGGLVLDDTQWALFRAGHAHAGVWVVLSVVIQILLDAAVLSPAVKCCPPCGTAGRRCGIRRLLRSCLPRKLRRAPLFRRSVSRCCATAYRDRIVAPTEACRKRMTTWPRLPVSPYSTDSFSIGNVELSRRLRPEAGISTKQKLR
jgi:hypothetical protein